MKPFCLALLLLCGCSSTKWTEGVPNLAQVDPGVWRGGQPTPSGWKYLATLGLTNELKLNEGPLVLAHGTYVPITTEEQIFGPVNQTKVTTKLISPGTFIHCEHGQDRTGLVVAVYRVQHDGWTKEQAEKEMLNHGFHKSLGGLWRAWQAL